MPAPAADAVEQLREAGHALNRLLPAMSTACTDAQRSAIAARITAALDRITAAATGVRLTAPAGPGGGGGGGGGSGGDGWRLVRVTIEPATVEVWSAAAAAAGFRSVANWVRDALAGLYGLAVARPPTPVTIDARTVAGRLLGLIAQTETAVADWPSRELDRRAEAGGEALYVALECGDREDHPRPLGGAGAGLRSRAGPRR